jgi:hypothetical protein
MRQLNGRHRALAQDESCHAGVRFNMRVGPDAKVARSDAAAGLDRGGLGHDQSGAAGSTRAQVNQVPVIGHAIGG